MMSDKVLVSNRKSCEYVFKQGKRMNQQCGSSTCKKDPENKFCASHYKPPMTTTDLLDKQYQDMLDKDKKEEKKFQKSNVIEVVEVRDRAPEPQECWKEAEKNNGYQKEAVESADEDDEYDNDDNEFTTEEFLNELRVLKSMTNIKKMRERIDYTLGLFE